MLRGQAGLLKSGGKLCLTHMIIKDMGCDLISMVMLVVCNTGMPTGQSRLHLSEQFVLVAV